MKSRTIFFLIVFSVIILFSTVCFAEEDMMNDTMDSAENTMESAGNFVEDTASGMANGVRNGVNGVANAMGNMGATMMNTMDMDDEGDNYTAERTSTTGYTNEGTFLGLNSTAWTWIVMGIVGAAVIGLIIYYNTQKDYDRNRSRNRDNY
ncbi:MAG: hypothetical protein J6M60_00675 [Clostridia bacterium]|nr:hypothetical protein [Clostridia bacterium]